MLVSRHGGHWLEGAVYAGQEVALAINCNIWRVLQRLLVRLLPVQFHVLRVK